MKWFLFVLLAGMPLVSYAEPDPSYERLLKELDSVPLGISKAELLERLPDLRPAEPRSPFAKMDQLQRSAQEAPPFVSQHFVFSDGRLSRIILSNDVTSMMTGGWESGDAIAHWGKSAIQAMRRQWGPPNYAKKRPMMGMLNWEKRGRHTSLMFSTSAEMVAFSKKLGSSAGGMFALYITSSPPKTFEEMHAGRGRLSTETFSDAAMDVDYAAFRRGLEVESLPETARVMPGSLGKVFLGMPVSDLKSIRPALKADNFFNGRTTFYERPTESDGTISYIQYAARMDKIIRVEVDPMMTTGAAARWCRKTWGEPSGRVSLISKNGLLNDHIRFVWKFNKAQGILSSGFIKGTNQKEIQEKNVRVSVLHENSDIRHALHHEEIEEHPLDQTESKRVWKLLLAQP